MPKTTRPRNFQARHVKTSSAVVTDVYLSIKPEHISNIALRLKNHDYRRYLLPKSVQRIWFYTTAPISSIHYIARISSGRVPGQVPEDGGIGNADFNAGKKVSKYGYEILELWELDPPISLQQAKAKGYLKAPPQRFCRVPQVVIDDFLPERQKNIFTKFAAKGGG